MCYLLNQKRHWNNVSWEPGPSTSGKKMHDIKWKVAHFTFAYNIWYNFRPVTRGDQYQFVEGDYQNVGAEKREVIRMIVDSEWMCLWREIIIMKVFIKGDNKNDGVCKGR